MLDQLIARTLADVAAGKLLPPGLSRQSPTSDLILTVDKVTKEYVHYKEFSAGTMVVAPALFLNRRMGDVLPEVAAVFDAAIWTANREQRAVDIRYEVNGHKRRAHVVVQGGLAALNIDVERTG